MVAILLFVEEDEFMANPSYYIDNAYDKSENDADEDEITTNLRPRANKP